MEFPKDQFLARFLFLIFINDLPNASNFYIKLFADHSFLCAQNSDLLLLEKEVNFEIVKVYEWLVANRLTLNISKSKFMLVSNKKIESCVFEVKLNDTLLERCEKYKYLGVMFDKNLSWKSHIEYVSGKISKVCGSLSKLRHSVNTQLLVEIYNALIHSYIRYGIITWCNPADTVLSSLQTIINRAIRIITFAPFGRIDINSLFKELKILVVSDTCFLEKSKFIFKLKNGHLPVTIANHFEYLTPNHATTYSYSLRPSNRQKYIVPRLRSSENSIQVNGEKIWNKIPESVKQHSTLITFKRELKLFLLEDRS